MAVKRTVVCGLYQNSEHAERAVAEFLAAGFSKESLTTTESDNHGTTSEARTGGNKLSVHCDTSDQISQAKDLLKRSGARDISSAVETREIFVES
jgi:hypothetical protein